MGYVSLTPGFSESDRAGTLLEHEMDRSAQREIAFYFALNNVINSVSFIFSTWVRLFLITPWFSQALFHISLIVHDVLVLGICGKQNVRLQSLIRLLVSWFSSIHLSVLHCDHFLVL